MPTTVEITPERPLNIPGMKIVLISQEYLRRHLHQSTHSPIVPMMQQVKAITNLLIESYVLA
jgi:hypothetical protein